MALIKELQFSISIIDKVSSDLNKITSQLDKIKNRTVEIKAATNTAAFNKVTESVNKIPKEKNVRITAETSGVEQGVGRVGKMLSGLKSTASGIFTGVAMGAGFAAFSSIGNILSEGVTRAQDLAKAQRVLINNYHFSTSAAQSYVEKLQQIKANTNIDTTTFLTAAEHLASLNVSADKAKTIISDVADAMNKTGGGASQLTSVTNVLAMGMQKGTLTGRQLMTMMRAGIPIYDIMRQQLHMTDEQIKAVTSTSKKNSDAGVMDYTKLAGAIHNWAAGAKGAAGTFGGSLQNMKDQLSDIIALFAAPAMSYLSTTVFPQIKTALAGALPSIQSFAKYVVQMGGSFASSVGPPVKTVISLLEKLAPVVKDVAAVFAKLPGGVQLGLVAMVGMTVMIPTMVGAMRSLKSMVGETQLAFTVLKSVFTGFSEGGIVGAIRAVTNALGITKAGIIADTGATEGNTIAKTLNSAATAVWGAAQTVAAGLSGVLTTATGLLTGAFTALGISMDALGIGLIITAIAALAAGLIYAYNVSPPFRAFVQGLAADLGGLLGAIQPVISAVQTLAGLIANNPLVTSFVQSAGAVIAAPLTAAKAAAKAVGGSTGGWVTSGGIQHFAGGGEAGKDTIPAWLSEGEMVLNKRQQTAMTGGVGGQKAEAGKNILTQTLAPTAMTMYGSMYALQHAFETFVGGKRLEEIANKPSTQVTAKAVSPIVSSQPQMAAPTTPVKHMAAGGKVQGTSGVPGDSVLAWLTSGETVSPQPVTSTVKKTTPTTPSTIASATAGNKEIVKKLTDQHTVAKEHKDLFNTWMGGRNQLDIAQPQLDATNTVNMTTATGSTNVATTSATGSTNVAGTVADAGNAIVEAVVNKTARTVGARGTNPTGTAAGNAAALGGSGTTGGTGETGGGGTVTCPKCGYSWNTGGTSSKACTSCGQPTTNTNGVCASCQNKQTYPTTSTPATSTPATSTPVATAANKTITMYSMPDGSCKYCNADLAPGGLVDQLRAEGYNVIVNTSTQEGTYPTFVQNGQTLVNPSNVSQFQQITQTQTQTTNPPVKPVKPLPKHKPAATAAAAQPQTGGASLGEGIGALGGWITGGWNALTNPQTATPSDHDVIAAYEAAHPDTSVSYCDAHGCHVNYDPKRTKTISLADAKKRIGTTTGPSRASQIASTLINAPFSIPYHAAKTYAYGVGLTSGALMNAAKPEHRTATETGAAQNAQLAGDLRNAAKPENRTATETGAAQNAQLIPNLISGLGSIVNFLTKRQPPAAPGHEHEKTADGNAIVNALTGGTIGNLTDTLKSGFLEIGNVFTAGYNKMVNATAAAASTAAQTEYAKAAQAGATPEQLAKSNANYASGAVGITPNRHLAAPMTSSQIATYQKWGGSPTPNAPKAKGTPLPLGGYATGHSGGWVTDRGIQHFATGGEVGEDNIPAMLSKGEMVLNKRQQTGLGIARFHSGGLLGGAVDWIGSIWDRMNSNLIHGTTPGYVTPEGKRHPEWINMKHPHGHSGGVAYLHSGGLLGGAVDWIGSIWDRMNSNLWNATHGQPPYQPSGWINQKHPHGHSGGVSSFHSGTNTLGFGGGLKNDEILAVLQTGERIFSQEDTKKLDTAVKQRAWANKSSPAPTGHTFNIGHTINIQGNADANAIETLIAYLGSPEYREKIRNALKEPVKSLVNEHWDNDMYRSAVR